VPSRDFRGSDGLDWRVWSVVPGRAGAAERRLGYDRRSPDPVLRPQGGRERRSGAERRERPPLLNASLTAGWLVFESLEERRRLAPIPPGWERLGGAGLERLLERARRAAASADADGGPEHKAAT
jgi:hypothetical protein